MKRHHSTSPLPRGNIKSGYGYVKAQDGSVEPLRVAGHAYYCTIAAGRAAKDNFLSSVRKASGSAQLLNGELCAANNDVLREYRVILPGIESLAVARLAIAARSIEHEIDATVQICAVGSGAITSAGFKRVMREKIGSRQDKLAREYREQPEAIRAERIESKLLETALIASRSDDTETVIGKVAPLLFKARSNSAACELAARIVVLGISSAQHGKQLAGQSAIDTSSLSGRIATIPPSSTVASVAGVKRRERRSAAYMAQSRKLLAEQSQRYSNMRTNVVAGGVIESGAVEMRPADSLPTVPSDDITHV